MNRAEAIVRVKLLAATSSRPAVADSTVESAVDTYPLPDGNGRLAGDPLWSPVYDVNAATAEVWRVKAGMVASDFNFTADNAQFSKGDVLAHCLEMEAKYASMAGSVSGVGSAGSAGTIQVAGTNTVNTLDQIAARLVP